jgi:hypothetical protein
MSHRSLLVALACLAGARAPAQENKENKPQGFAAERALLQRMIDEMSALPACMFTVEQEQKSDIASSAAMLEVERTVYREARAAGVDPAQFVWTSAPNVATNRVAGGWSDGLLWTSANEGKNLAVWHGRRAIARQDQQAWKPRQRVLGDGLPMPSPLDPDTFFLALQHGKLELIHSEVGSLDDKPAQIVTGHAAADDASDLLWSGLLPEATTSSFDGPPRLRGRLKPDIDLDMAIWIDPATARAQQIKVRCYKRLVERRAAAGAQANGAAEAKKEEAAKEEPERLTFADGLPVRTPKAQMPVVVVRYDVVFGSPGAAPALDDAARAMLGLPAAK